MTSAQASMQVTVKNSQKIHSVPQKTKISLTPVTLLDLTNSQQCRSLSISMQHFQVVFFFEAGKVRTGKKTRKIQSFRSRHAFGTPWHQAFRVGVGKVCTADSIACDRSTVGRCIMVILLVRQKFVNILVVFTDVELEKSHQNQISNLLKFT